jgi:ABC-type glycerol-3-phosphate transport system substrate-binding protein
MINYPFKTGLASLVLVITLLLNGCTSLNPQPGDNPSFPITSDETITFAVYKEERQFYEGLIADFKKQNQGIRVQLVPIGDPLTSHEEPESSTYWQQIASSADVVFISDQLGFDTSQFFRNLKPLLEADPSFHPNDFWNSALSACADPYGNLAGIPSVLSLYGIFFDQAIFDAAGLSYPKPGWTWVDFQNYITALVSSFGPERVIFLDQPAFKYSILAPIVMQHTGYGTTEVDPQSILKDIQWYFDLSGKGSIKPIRVVKDWQMEDKRLGSLFQDGLGPAMWVGHITDQRRDNRAESSSEDDPYNGWSIGKYGFVPFPVNVDDPSSSTNLATGRCLAISTGTQNISAAWAWLKYLSTKWLLPEKGSIEGISSAPANRSVAEEQGFFESIPLTAQDPVRFSLDHAWFGGSYQREIELLEPVLLRVLDGQSSFLQAFGEIQSALPRQVESSKNSPISVATPQKPLAPDVKVVRFFVQLPHSPGQEKAIEDLIKKYNEDHPEINIQLSNDAQGDVSWISQNSDCFYAYEPFWEMTSPGNFLDISPLFENEPAGFREDFILAVLDPYRWEGKLYGLPAVSQPYVIAYNADLLARRGLQPPSNEWTFDEFIQLATAASSSTTSDVSYGFEYASWPQLFFAGHNLQWINLNSDPPRIDFDSSEMTSYLAWLKGMVDAGVLTRFGDGSTEYTGALQRGQMAFWLAMAGSNGLPLNPGENPSFAVGYAPVPVMPREVDLIRGSQSQGFFISPVSKEHAACWDWIKFLSGNVYFLDGIPARRSLTESGNWVARVGEKEAAVYRSALEGITPFDEQPKYPPIAGPLFSWKDDIVARVLEGQEIVQTLSATQAKADAYLGCISQLDYHSLSGDNLYKAIDGCVSQADPLQ